MASHGYALVTDALFTDSVACDIADLPNITPVKGECYWRPRTNFLDLLRDDLYSETHQH